MYVNARRSVIRLVMLAAFVSLQAIPLFAQQARTLDTQGISVAGDIDFRNAYLFRGVRQDDTGLVTWPSAEIGVPLHSADRGLTGARVRVGTFNSLHSGWTGSDGPAGKRWYESDLYTTLSLAFAKSLAIDTTYTSYHSPNKMFTNMKEIAFRASTDGPAIGGASIKPYALAAFELDTKPGIGQLDGGFKAGRYLELGATPARSMRRIGIAVPVRVGLSIGNYYELAGQDHAFGFVSAGGIATLLITQWLNLHGGVEVDRLGETTKAFNAGNASKTIASIGVGFSR
jgi:hypothetical protein